MVEGTWDPITAPQDGIVELGLGSRFLTRLAPFLLLDLQNDLFPTKRSSVIGL